MNAQMRCCTAPTLVGHIDRITLATAAEPENVRILPPISERFMRVSHPEADFRQNVWQFGAQNQVPKIRLSFR
jgi:hypothetical protein